MNKLAVTGFWALGAAALLPTSAFAHAGHAEGFAAGIAHPFTGLDHAIAALAAGWWAAAAGRRQGGMGVAAFLAALLGGMALGASGLVLIGQETALAGTVLALGVLLAFGVRPSPKSVALALAGFALVHGLAHGSEVPQLNALTGIALGTALLLTIGTAAGILTRSPNRLPLQRLAGAAAGIAGLALLTR